MAICMVFSPPKDLFNTETYEKVLAHLGKAFPPSAMSLHVKGVTDKGETRIVDIFETAEEFKKFAESHAPVYEELGISVDDILKHAMIFEIEKLIK